MGRPEGFLEEGAGQIQCRERMCWKEVAFILLSQCPAAGLLFLPTPSLHHRAQQAPTAVLNQESKLVETGPEP